MAKKKGKIKNTKKQVKKIKFVNPLYIIILFVLAILAFLISSALSMRCWDGVNINEEGIMRACGVSVEEFYQLTEINQSFCMDGWTYIRAVGKCGPTWSFVIAGVIAVLIIYNIFYLVYYLNNKNGHKKVR